MGDFGGSSKMRVEQGVRDALHESGPSAGLSPTERRWNRTIQAEGCSALPVLKTGCVTDSQSLSRSHFREAIAVQAPPSL
jgi:hypothetical protein